MKKILSIKNVCKNFDGNDVLRNISVDVKEGEILGLLGVNGAGKTTLLKVISGLIKPTEGEIFILEKSPWYNHDSVGKDIGIMIETPVFYEHLTAYENLEIHLKYMGVNADIEDILQQVGLTSIEKKIVAKFSLGMRQRLGIARAISHKPKLLILDEPINGLDPIAIKEMRNLLINLRNKGTTIILSSHILNEVLQTAETIAVISNKTLEELGEISDLQKQQNKNLENFLLERMRG